MIPAKPVIFFDGVCGLCNAFVDFVLAHDRERRFLFAPLQGSVAKDLLPPEMTADLNTVVLWRPGQPLLTKSEAALTVLKELGGAWQWIRVFGAVPGLLADRVYDLVAENRYRIFGRRDVCRVPTSEERAHFLD